MSIPSIEQVMTAVEKIDASIEKLDAALERINGKLQGFRDELKQEVRDMTGRVIELEVAQKVHREQDSRFLDNTWPNHEKYVYSVDERVRSLEREQVQLTKIHELEARITIQAKNTEDKIAVALKTAETKIIEVEKKSDHAGWSLNLINTAIPIIISAIVSLASWYFTHGIKP